MTLPAGNSQTFYVNLEFETNALAIFNQVEKETEGIADETKRVQEITRRYGEEIKRLHPDLFKQIEEEKKLAEQMAKSKEETKKRTLEIRNLRAEARLVTNEVRLLRDQADDLDRVFKPLAVGGAFITGGIFALANKYVNEATEATEVTREWKAAQANLAQSGKEIGAVLAQEALPLLKEAAQVTSKVADIIQKNPQVVKAALYGGLLALAVGTIGKLYTSGLRLYADIKLDKAMALQFAAAELQLKASQNQLTAAGIQSKSTLAGGAVSGVGSTLRNIGLVGTGLAIGTGLTVKVANELDNLGDHLQKLGGVSEGVGTGIKAAVRGIGAAVPALQGFIDRILNDGERLSDATSLTSKTQSFLGGSKENQDQAVQAFTNWKSDDARIVKDAMETRKKIIAEGERDIANITREFTSQTASIGQRFSDEARQINSKFAEENKKADEREIEERGKTIRDEEKRISEIRAEAQEKRREAERNFAKASNKAAQDRDALALEDARTARDEALAEANRGADETIQKEKRETQERLQELSIRYDQERKQREQQHEADLKENSARRAAEMKEAQDKYTAEIKQARDANAAKLKEAADAANRERIEKRNQFTAELSDLGIVLNSERQLRQQAYGSMLGDLNNWLNQVGGVFAGLSAAGLGSASGGSTSGTTSSTTGGNTGTSFWGNLFGTHDYSDYAYRGIYKMAQDGQPQWVMGGRETKAAEDAIGGRLTQNNVSQMIALMAALRGSMQYVDNTQYGKDMNTRQIRDIKEAQARSLDKLVGGY